jgi:polyisoprenoid-binding protein YceI
MRLFGSAGAVLTLIFLGGCGQAVPSVGDEPAPASTAAPAMAAWTLDPEASRIGFISVKAGEVIEAHHFEGLEGQVSPAGEAMVTIPLDRVETKIDIRNERMREMFFETADYPTATVSTNVKPADYAGLAIGERAPAAVEGVLSLHGVEAPVFADAYVTRIAEDRIEVVSAEPVIVSVADFGLEGGLEALREVAGLPAITASSAVTFTFVFEAEDG